MWNPLKRPVLKRHFNTIKTPLKHCLNSTVFIKDKGCLLSCACNNNHPKV